MALANGKMFCLGWGCKALRAGLYRRGADGARKKVVAPSRSSVYYSFYRQDEKKATRRTVFQEGPRTAAYSLVHCLVPPSGTSLYCCRHNTLLQMTACPGRLPYQPPALLASAGHAIVGAFLSSESDSRHFVSCSFGFTSQGNCCCYHLLRAASVKVSWLCFYSMYSNWRQRLRWSG